MDADVYVLISMLPLVVALNRLIRMAEDASYIARLDADDVIADAKAFQAAVRYLDAYPSVQLVYGALEGFDPGNPPGANVIFRRSLWSELGGYDESLSHQEATDFDLRARAMYPRSVQRLEVNWYDYRRRPGSMSADVAAILKEKGLDKRPEGK